MIKESKEKPWGEFTGRISTKNMGFGLGFSDDFSGRLDSSGFASILLHERP
jgi:hypothetical protein